MSGGRGRKSEAVKVAQPGKKQMTEEGIQQVNKKFFQYLQRRNNGEQGRAHTEGARQKHGKASRACLLKKTYQVERMVGKTLSRIRKFGSRMETKDAKVKGISLLFASREK